MELLMIVVIHKFLVNILVFILLFHIHNHVIKKGEIIVLAGFSAFTCGLVISNANNLFILNVVFIGSILEDSIMQYMLVMNCLLWYWCLNLEKKYANTFKLSNLVIVI